MRTFRPKHYILQELVSPQVFTSRGEAAWELLDGRMLVTLDAFRERYGPIAVNNWHMGGTFQESGLRTFDSTTGAKLSQHRYGRGYDCKPKLITPQEMYEDILKHPEEFPYLTTLEDIASTPSWVHGDCRNNASDTIRIVKP